MKKLVQLLIIFTLTSGVANAQYGSYSGSFRTFRVDFGAAYSNPGGDELDAGIGFYVNPKFHMNDNLLLGIKYETTAIGATDDDFLDVSSIVCYASTIDYYVSDNNFRPFAGVDIGIYELGTLSTTIMNNTTEIELGSKFGIAPKIGCSYGHLDFTLQYNLIFDQDERFNDFNHASIKIGFHLGGGIN
ncbi:hypothetical protein BZG02_18945 [Labilibaculum filiforme]|uniref:Outer membrane protein beta-barrel domain-containing protein n=1 Tax=Labilibaculum filiforme TaxID=1940526 RepID=A0A2N3HR59_9BACT|nr:hypothetical protein [Labilibaculum filiforme]PKQ60543.1 hypothetical protein BZG02_18945 [Labilibaculum filiforme]